ncbi:MAG: hypothetical protein QXS85_03330 [Acidilobaceae archaeon]
MTMLHSDRYISVVVDGSRVRVGGRVYETSHVFIVGASTILIEMTPLKLRMETLVPVESRIDSTMEDVLKIYVPDYKFEVDSQGARMSIKQNELIEMRGDIVTVKLESDIETDSVIVKIPGFRKIKTQRVRITAENEVSANFILSPLVGVISISRAHCILRTSESDLEITCELVEREQTGRLARAEKPLAESLELG